MTELTDLSETDADNTIITSANIAEGCAPSGINDAIRKTLGLVRRAFRSNIFRVRDSTDQTKLLAFDVSGVTTGTTRTLTVPDRSGTLSLTSDIDVRRNRVVNHDMRESQENGTTPGTANGYYAVDQWATYRVTSAGVITSAQVVSTTPAGSPFRYRVTITTADASLAAGEYLTITQNLESPNVGDFQYGRASASDSVLRFGFKGPAGTYAVHLGNGSANRSYVALFTISAGEANTDTVQSFAIPGDTTGTWSVGSDGVIGITVDIVLACGTTFQGTTGWQTGLRLGTSAVSNGMATAGAIFELFDVGFKRDPDATGVYGAYEPGAVHAVWHAKRYGLKLNAEPLGISTNGFLLSSIGFRTDLCKTPTLVSGATFSVSSGNAGTVALRSETTKSVASFTNSANNWTPSVSVAVTGFLSARLS